MRSTRIIGAAALAPALAVGALAGLPTVAHAAPTRTPAAPAAASAPRHARPVTTTNFPDPGFAKFGGRYYLYATGSGFPVKSSARPESGYGTAHASMAKRPAWVVQKGQANLWAPSVFSSVRDGKRIYVMYFSGLSATTGHDCVGVATSSSPDHGFVAQKHALLCAPTKGQEAIDASQYRGADGNRYLVYKTSDHNRKDWDIRAVRMDAAGTARVKGVASRSILRPGFRTEAPSVIRHDGKVYLFTANGSWTNCSYHTDVWVASSLWGGHFRELRTVLASNRAAGLCGPGGATVIQDGNTTRIAFAAYREAGHTGKPASKARYTWVGVLRWSKSGVPSLV